MTTVYLRGVKSEELEHLLTFLYTGQLSLPRPRLPAVLTLARDLRVLGLAPSLQRTQASTSNQKNRTRSAQKSNERNVVAVGDNVIRAYEGKGTQLGRPEEALKINDSRVKGQVEDIEESTMEENQIEIDDVDKSVQDTTIETVADQKIIHTKPSCATNALRPAGRDQSDQQQFEFTKLKRGRSVVEVE